MLPLSLVSLKLSGVVGGALKTGKCLAVYFWRPAFWRLVQVPWRPHTCRRAGVRVCNTRHVTWSVQLLLAVDAGAESGSINARAGTRGTVHQDARSIDLRVNARDIVDWCRLGCEEGGQNQRTRRGRGRIM